MENSTLLMGAKRANISINLPQAGYYRIAKG
jgi:hypothetical protein